MTTSQDLRRLLGKEHKKFHAHQQVAVFRRCAGYRANYSANDFSVPLTPDFSSLSPALIRTWSKNSAPIAQPEKGTPNTRVCNTPDSRGKFETGDQLLEGCNNGRNFHDHAFCSPEQKKICGGELKISDKSDRLAECPSTPREIKNRLAVKNGARGENVIAAPVQVSRFHDLKLLPGEYPFGVLGEKPKKRHDRMKSTVLDPDPKKKHPTNQVDVVCPLSGRVLFKGDKVQPFSVDYEKPSDGKMKSLKKTKPIY